MRKAVEAALTGKSTTKIADEYNIPARTLRRYVANEKRDADHPKLLKTVDLGLSGLAKQQRLKAAAAAAAAAGKPGSPSPMKSSMDAKKKAAAKNKFTAKHMKTMAKNMKKHAMEKKKKQAQSIANVSLKKPGSTESGAAAHHQMMMNYNPPPSVGMNQSGNSRMRANSFEMLLKAYEFEYMMNNGQKPNNKAATTSNSASGAANTASGARPTPDTSMAAASAGRPSGGNYDRHLSAGSIMFDAGDPSWPRRRTRTNSLDLLLNAAKLDTAAHATDTSTPTSASAKPSAKAGMMLAPSLVANTNAKSKPVRPPGAAGPPSTAVMKAAAMAAAAEAKKVAASRLPSNSMDVGETLPSLHGHVKDPLRDRMSSFDSDLWARSRSMSNLSVPGDPYGARDRRASSMDLYDSLMHGGEPRRNRFDSGSLDMLIQACGDEKNHPGRGGAGRVGTMSIGTSFGSMSDLVSLGFTSDGKTSRSSSLAKPSELWEPSTAPMRMEYMEPTSKSPTKAAKRKASADSAPKTKKGRQSGKGKTASKQTSRAAKATSRARTTVRPSAATTKKTNLKFKMSRPVDGGAKKKSGAKRGKSKTTVKRATGHALDIGRWKH